MCLSLHIRRFRLYITSILNNNAVTYYIITGVLYTEIGTLWARIFPSFVFIAIIHECLHRYREWLPLGTRHLQPKCSFFKKNYIILALQINNCKFNHFNKEYFWVSIPYLYRMGFLVSEFSHRRTLWEQIETLRRCLVYILLLVGCSYPPTKSINTLHNFIFCKLGTLF